MLGETVCVFLALQTLAHSFNLSPAKIFKDADNQPGNYFGYTVALQRRTTPYGHWVIVGAPRANASSQQTVVEPGVAYECDVQTTDCTPVDLHKSSTVYEKNSKYVYKEKEDNAWIGGSIDVQDQNDGRIVVCGPRSVHHQANLDGSGEEVYRLTGVCFVKSSSSVEHLAPLNDRGKFTSTLEASTTGRNSTRVHFYEHGQAGISVHFVQNTSELLIGAPGILQWRGTMIRYQSRTDLEDAATGSGNKIYGSPFTPHPGKNPRLADEGYFGYSVDSGALYTRDSTSYVAGAPRAASLKGKVLVFDYPDNSRSNYSEFKVIAEIEGTQMGEYFGATVCAVDLNGDGLDDLVVGAPMYTIPLNYPGQTKGSEGRVYVFLNSGQGIFTSGKSSIVGTDVDGRFGSAISKIGDVNSDGFNDIAVGAPYGHKDGRGVIFIYHGGRSGVSPKHSQQITAESVSKELAGFGISISRGMDVDGNRFNDIAVGAYLSGHVVLLTARVIVTLRPSLEFKSASGESTIVSVIEKNATGFVVVACLTSTGAHTPETVDVRVKLTADARTQFVSNDLRTRSFSFDSVLSRNNPECKEVVVEITKPENFNSPLEIKMNFQLDTTKEVNNSLGFCGGCPMVDPSAPNFAAWRLPFVTELTDLTIRTDFADPQMVVILGTKPRLEMKITVSNTGQPAYRTTIRVMLPSLTSLLGFGGEQWRKYQNTSVTTLERDLQEVATGETKVLDLWVEVDTIDVAEGTTSLLFSFETFSDGVEQNPRDNLVVVSLSAKMVADVAVSAISNQIHEKISGGEKQNFSHTYVVKSYGPSRLSILKLTFNLPVTLKTPSGEIHLVNVYKPVPTLDNQPFQCSQAAGPDLTPHEDEGIVDTEMARSRMKRSSSDELARQSDITQFPPERTLIVNCSSENTTCVTVECMVGPFAPNRSTAIVSFRMEVDFKNIGPALGERDVLVISSTGRATLVSGEIVQPTDHRPDVSTANTVFYGEQPVTQIDQTIFYASVAGGAIILLIIILVCWKVGFFKRQLKEELADQKNAVEL